MLTVFSLAWILGAIDASGASGCYAGRVDFTRGLLVVLMRRACESQLVFDTLPPDHPAGDPTTTEDDCVRTSRGRENRI